MTIRPAPLFHEIEPPKGLFSDIMLSITRARQQKARIQLVVFGTVTFISLLLLIPVMQYALQEFYASGFYDYASLFFDSIARGYWQEILYSLTDSLPSFALLLLAAIGTAIVWSSRNVTKNARIVFTHHVSA